jgi:transposase-like protein
MHKAGYYIEDIQKLVGVPSRRVLRKWLREFGAIAGRSAQYPEEVKQTCLTMYADGCTPRQIENETGIPADTITDWAMHAGLSRSQKYSDEIKQQCLNLYQQGLTSEQIHAQIGIHPITIRSWISKAKISRDQKRYSEKEIENCLNLYQQGINVKEIAEITQIKEVTIRSWIRKHGLNKQKNRIQIIDKVQLSLFPQISVPTPPKQKRKQSGYWKDFENVKREILNINEQRGELGMMPTAEQLKRLGRTDLQRAISKHHGGFQSVAEQLGLEFKKKRAGYWQDFANIEKHILAFISLHGTADIMPTKQELEEAGEGSLANAMNLHGGFPEVAQRLGLKLSYSRKERDYWKDTDNFKSELLQVVEQLGTPGVMPTHEQLTEIGRTDLIAAITSNGGCPSVARRVGLTYVKQYNNPNDDF